MLEWFRSSNEHIYKSDFRQKFVGISSLSFTKSSRISWDNVMTQIWVSIKNLRAWIFKTKQLARRSISHLNPRQGLSWKKVLHDNHSNFSVFTNIKYYTSNTLEFCVESEYQSEQDKVLDGPQELKIAWPVLNPLINPIISRYEQDKVYNGPRDILFNEN